MMFSKYIKYTILCVFFIGCKHNIDISLNNIHYCYDKSKAKVINKGDLNDRFIEQSFFIFLDGSCVSCLAYLDTFGEFIYSNSETQNYNWFFCLSVNNEFDFTERISRVMIPENGTCYFLGFKEFSNDFLEEGTIKYVEGGCVENVFRVNDSYNCQEILNLIESK